MQRFKQALWSYIKNPRTNHRIPVLQTPTGADVRFINLYPNNKEAQYFEWMALLHSYLCSMTGDDPNALGLASNKGMMEGKTLQTEGLDGATRRSNQLGRDTYLQWFVNSLNKWGLVPQLTGHEDWKLEVTGLVNQNAQAKQELERGEFNLYATMNEIRAKNDLDEVDVEEFPWAAIAGFGNQNIANAYSMKQQQEMQEQMQQGQEGMEQGFEGQEEGQEGYENDENYEDYEDEMDLADELAQDDENANADDGPGLYDNFVFNEDKESESIQDEPESDTNTDKKVKIKVDKEKMEQ